jgi:hypothetical protein
LLQGIKISYVIMMGMIKLFFHPGCTWKYLIVEMPTWVRSQNSAHPGGY